MRRKLAVTSIACTALVLVLSGCTGSTPAPTVTATVTAAAPSTPVPAVTVTVAASTPAPATPAVFTTMAAAAKHLYASWEAGDKVAATEGASASAVDALFARTWKSGVYFFGGCDDTTGCQYNFDTGAINMKISGNASSGYTVTAVTFGSAG